MKLQKIELKNFAKFSDIEVIFNNQVTHLVGMNGSGKSTIGITAIQACLKGIAENNKNGQLIGERFRFIGTAKKSADIIITIIDESRNGAEIVVRNKITENSNNITFEAPNDYNIDGDWLNNLFNIAFLSAKNFTQLSAKEQALALGIDVSIEDNAIAAAKADITIINREIKGYGILEIVEKVEFVSITDLLNQKRIIDLANQESEKNNNEIERIKREVIEFKLKRDSLIIELDKVENKISDTEDWLGRTKYSPLKSTIEIENQLSELESNNRKASNYIRYSEKKQQIDKANLALEKAKERVRELEIIRSNKIQSFDFGFKSLSVDEGGGLLLNGRPIKEPYYSKGELEIIVANLYIALNPNLKMRFIDDFDLIDEDNQIILIKDLIDAGFQIITAEVGKEKDGENVLILKEGKIYNQNLIKK